MNNTPKTRRQFIKLASSLLAVPFASIPSVRAFGQTSGENKAPLRLLTIIDSYGIPTANRNGLWINSESGDYALRASQLGTILSPLSDYTDNMLVLSGNDLNSLKQTRDGTSHTNITVHTLTGSRSIDGRDNQPGRRTLHSSLDFRVGKYLNDDYGLAAPRVYPHLLLSDYAERGKNTFSHDDDGNQVRSIAGPKNIATSLFSGNTDTSELQYQYLAQGGVLDLINQRISAVSGQLGNLNKNAVIDAYRSSVDDLATELELRAQGSCQAPSSVDPLSEDTTRVAVNTSPYVFDNIYQAFACDLASSITYAVGGEQINQLNHGALYNANEHDSEVQGLLRKNLHAASHRTDAVANKVHELVRAYQAELIAGLLDRMRNTTDVDGSSLLDNTVVYWTSAMSNNTHKVDNYASLLIAGKNTQLIGGFHYDLSDSTNNDLLTTIARGLTLEVDSFGGHNQNGNYLNALNNGPISKMLKS